MYKIYARLRDKKHVTDYEVAKQAGLSRSTLSEWKKGSLQPSIETLKKLSEYFNVSIDYLVNGDKKTRGK